MLITRTTNRRAGLLRHMSRQIPTDTLAQLYLSYVRPTMEYASQVWHGSITTDQALSQERIQAGVARCLLRADWMTPKHQMLEQVGWSALCRRRAVASIILFHQLKIQPPSRLEEHVPPTSSSQTGRSLRKSEQLLLPKLRTKRLSNSFFYHASLLWNSLPANIQNLQKSEDFKSALEQHWAALKFRPSADIPLPAMNWRHFFSPLPFSSNFVSASPVILCLSLSSSSSYSFSSSSSSSSSSLSLSASPFSVVYSHLYPFFSCRAHPACRFIMFMLQEIPSMKDKLPCWAILQILTKKKKN